MRKIAYLSLSTVIALGAVGCSKNEKVADTKVLEINQEIQLLRNDIDKLNRKLRESNREIDSLEKLIPQQSTGIFTVTATKLNMRQDASEDLESMGTLDYGTKLNVIDTSNPLWYKVSLDLNGYSNEKKDNSIIYKLDGNSLEVKNTYIKNVNTFYVSSRYLSNQDIVMPTEAPVGENPFVYGLNFFDSQTARLLSSEIWNTMKVDLEKLGYTGIQVVPMNRETYEDDIRNGKFDAVESAPGQFAKINSEKEYMQAFAKDVINDETNYSGIIIVNKDSGITDFSKLKNKTVLTGKEYSESSFRYQQYYLSEIHGIDIEKDLKLEKDNYHQEILYKVATGQADAGFCGDFVMTNSFGDMKASLALSNIDLESKEELENLRDNVIILNMKELAPIPNNTHSIKSELAANKQFVNKLYESVKKIYRNNKEGYDITDANNKEYEMLVEFE